MGSRLCFPSKENADGCQGGSDEESFADSSTVQSGSHGNDDQPEGLKTDQEGTVDKNGTDYKRLSLDKVNSAAHTTTQIFGQLQDQGEERGSNQYDVAIIGGGDPAVQAGLVSRLDILSVK